MSIWLHLAFIDDISSKISTTQCTYLTNGRISCIVTSHIISMADFQMMALCLIIISMLYHTQASLAWLALFSSLRMKRGPGRTSSFFFRLNRNQHTKERTMLELYGIIESVHPDKEQYVTIDE